MPLLVDFGPSRRRLLTLEEDQPVDELQHMVAVIPPEKAHRNVDKANARGERG